MEIRRMNRRIIDMDMDNENKAARPPSCTQQPTHPATSNSCKDEGWNEDEEQKEDEDEDDDEDEDEA